MQDHHQTTKSMNSGIFYHIYNRGNNRETIFKEPRNYSFFLQKFQEYLGHKVEVHAYSLMPNHFHFLLKIKENEVIVENTSPITKAPRKLTPIEKAFRDFFISYAKAINKSYNRTGSLFQYKFKRKQINTEKYYGTAITYIHRNPVEAKLCNDYEDWTYSSYKAFLSKKPTSICRNEVLDWYGGKAGFIEDHKAYHDFKSYEKFLGF